MSKEQKHRRYLDEHHICWSDGEGGLHIDAVKACKHFGVEPTQENQDAVVKGMLDGARVSMPGTPVTVLADEKPVSSSRCDHKFMGGNACVKCGWSLDQGGPMGGA